MPTIELNGHTYAVDEDGFLEDPMIWNEQVAVDLATTEGVTDLTENHWKLVQVPPQLLPRVRHRADDPEALQGERVQAERGLRDVPVGAGEGGVQGRRAAEAHRLRLGAHAAVLRPRDRALRRRGGVRRRHRVAGLGLGEDARAVPHPDDDGAAALAGLDRAEPRREPVDAARGRQAGWPSKACCSDRCSGTPCPARPRAARTSARRRCSWSARHSGWARWRCTGRCWSSSSGISACSSDPVPGLAAAPRGPRRIL